MTKGTILERSRINYNKECNRVLLVDEVDVFFDERFFGKLYRPCTNIKHETI
jgi:hypothetical protein